MSETIDLFRAFTGDQTIDSREISKFLKWGGGNLEQALNYYFRQKEKENKPEPKPAVTTRSKSSSDAFSKMNQAMVKQKRTEAFISKVREEYKLPIRGRSSLESKSQSRQKAEAEEGAEMDVEFAEADYLPQIFNQKDLSFQQMPNASFSSQNRRENSFQDQQRRLEIQEDEYEQKTQKSKLKEIHLNSFTPTRLAQPKNDLPKFEYAYDASEYYLGEVIVDAFAIRDEFKLEFAEGTPVEFRYYMEEPKKKKVFKSNKNAEKVMNMRIVGPNGEFGRLKDQQVKVFLPLIVHGMLRMELTCHYIPKRTQYYTPLKLKAKLHLLKKAVTEPVIETFEGHSDLIVSVYKTVAEETLSLFDRLQLPVRTEPLIKRKSKLKLREESIIQKREERGNRELDDERRRLQELQQRQRNDPLLKITQKSLTDMFRSKVSEASPEPKQKVVEEKSAVKRVVLELKTVEQDKCAQLVDLYEEDLQPIHPSTNFTSQLFDYQARALAWMMRREGDQQLQHREKEELHPLWTEFELPEGERMYLNQLTSQVSVKPPMSKAKCLGGILADEMGLGKTVMMAALIVSAAEGKREKRKNEGKNLVIVPLTLLSQWDSEIKRHTKNIKTLVYYGEQRKAMGSSLTNFDVVITTYGIISNQFSKGGHLSKTGLYKVRWERIILDEAHYIKGRVIQTAKAVYELDGLYRWCLTGTPIQNNLTDLFSLIHFIRYTPWAEYECWNKYINRPSEAGDDSVYEVLRTILKRVFLRRTKQSKDHEGKPIVSLPNKVSRIEILQMDEKERQFYDSIYECSRSTIEELDRQGILEARYMQVFEILIKLRQICCHPMLYKSASKYITDNSQFDAELRKFIKKREASCEGDRYYEPIMEGEEELRVEVTEGQAVSELYIKEVVAKVEAGEMDTCPVCLGQVEDPVITPCLHIFCRTCAIRQIEECGICSSCRRRLAREDMMLLPRENRFNVNLNDKQKYYRSSKIQALLERLLVMGPDDKVVIFSQFLGMLDLIEHELKLEGFSYVRMEGKTSHKDRTKIVEKFQKDPTVRIFIVSLKTAGVGLNLVAANKVFLMDPWWNPGVEDQAIERVHRIGQQREVEVVRFIMDRSIEMRMMELNTNKKQLSQKVLSQEGALAENKVEKLRYLMERY